MKVTNLSSKLRRQGTFTRTNCGYEIINDKNKARKSWYPLRTFEIEPKIRYKLFKKGRVYSASKNFTRKINLDVILPVEHKFYRQNKSRSYSAGKT